MTPENNGRSRPITFLTIAAILIASPLLAQAPDGLPPVFEVVSIKPHADPGSGPGLFGFQNVPGSPRMDMVGVTFKMLMAYAYAVRDFQITGGPDWIGSERYDIQAKAADGVPAPTGMRDLNVPDPMALRIQSLLNDRFQLKLHRETRTLPVYELIPAKGGSTLQLSADQGPPEPPQLGSAPERGSLFTQRSPSGWTLQATGVPVSSLINALSQLAGRPIVDRSGVNAGLYDIKLQWTTNDLSTGGPGLTGGTDQAAPAPGSEALSLYNAVERQLGLRLMSSKGPVEVFVIDDVQRPSAN